MKRWTVILPIAALGGFSALPLLAHAEEGTPKAGFFAGGGAIYTSIENDFVDQDFPDDEDDFDDDRVSWKALAGFRFNPLLSLEGQYVDFGKSDHGAASAEADGWTAAAVLDIPVPYVQPYAKAGALFWNTDARVEGPLNSSIKYSDDGTDFFWGLGVRFNLSENVALRAEYERFDLEGDNVETKIDAASLNLQFAF